MILLVLFYINQGLKIMLIIGSMTHLKRHFKASPSAIQLSIQVINLPTVFKVFYGFFSDAIPIYGYKKKPYLLIMGALQILTMTLIFTVHLGFVVAVIDITLCYFAVGFSDVIIDSLMVMQSRKLPLNGQALLMANMRMCQAIGGISGAFIAAVIT